MFTTTIVALTFLACSLAAPPNQLDRIAGGIAANLQLFPYVVALRNSGGWLLCSGSIIDEGWVVTAATCTTRAGDDLRIAAGTIYSYGGGQEIEVESVYQHPQFDPVSLDNDISILKLEQDLVFGSTVNKLNLPTQDQSVVVGANANITGFGRIFQGGNYPAVLLTTFVNIVSQEDCREVYGDAITDNMICTDYAAGGRGACQGDEGGPLVINNELVGVISWRSVCGTAGIPEVYASVPALRSFIADVTGL